MPTRRLIVGGSHNDDVNVDNDDVNAKMSLVRVAQGVPSSQLRYRYPGHHHVHLTGGKRWQIKQTSRSGAGASQHNSINTSEHINDG